MDVQTRSKAKLSDKPLTNSHLVVPKIYVSNITRLIQINGQSNCRPLDQTRKKYVLISLCQAYIVNDPEDTNDVCDVVVEDEVMKGKVNINPELSTEQVSKLNNLISQFPNVFF